MITPHNEKALLIVARCAMKQYDALSNEERILFLEGLSLILPPEQTEAAQKTLWVLKKAEQHQLQFKQLLGGL